MKRLKESVVYKNTNISEDVWFEILLRLPLKSIFKFKSVSKSWFSIISNPNFKTTRININILPPSTFFFQYDDRNLDFGYLPTPRNFRVIQSISTEEEEKVLFKSHDGFSFRFLSEEDAFSSNRRNEKVHLLASSNGLVLCSTTIDPPVRYVVCNPLTKRWVSIPHPKYHDGWLNDFKYFLTGFICESSSSSTLTSTVYKIVQINVVRRAPLTNFCIEIFSSDMGEWIFHNVSCPQEIIILKPIPTKVVTMNGVLYWIEGRNRIIAYDLNKNKNGGGQFILIDLPNQIRSGDGGYICSECLGESEGLISYCRIDIGSSEKTLSVWVLEGDYLNGGSVWHSVHKIELKDILFRNMLKPLDFNPVDRNVVILDSYICIAAYNIRTRTLKLLHKVGGWSYLTYKVLPFVLPSWPTAL